MAGAARSFTGYDACGHMSEETKAADNNAAWGIVLALLTSATVGFIYVLGLLFSIQACSPASCRFCHALERYF